MDSENLKKLLDIGRQMAETRELDPLLETAISLALDFVEAEYGYLVLLDNDNLVFRVGLDKDGNHLEEPQEQISRTIFDEVISSGKAAITADAMSSVDSSSVKELQIRSVMCAPLVSRGKVLGAIYVENRSGSNLFENDDLTMLEYFAAQSAVSIENVMHNDELETRVAMRTAELAQANTRLHDLAITDSLTGLFNRRYFFELAGKELARARRSQQSFSVVLLDLDNFKQINDQYGHLVGDQALQAVAKRIRDCIREIDILGRYGGEEFVMLMPDTDLTSAIQMAERVCLGMNSDPIKINEHSISMAASLGVATLEVGQDITIDSLLDQADQALYTAKREGRNRVVFYPKQ